MTTENEQLKAEIESLKSRIPSKGYNNLYTEAPDVKLDNPQERSALNSRINSLTNDNNILKAELENTRSLLNNKVSALQGENDRLRRQIEETRQEAFKKTFDTPTKQGADFSRPTSNFELQSTIDRLKAENRSLQREVDFINQNRNAFDRDKADRPDRAPSNVAAPYSPRLNQPDAELQALKAEYANLLKAYKDLSERNTLPQRKAPYDDRAFPSDRDAAYSRYKPAQPESDRLLLALFLVKAELLRLSQHQPRSASEPLNRRNNHGLRS